MAVVSRHGGLAPGMVRTMQEQQLNVILFLYILCQNATHTHTVVARETGEEVKGLQPQQHFGSILFLPQQLEL